MAEKSEQAFDPDATVKQPAVEDPDATVSMPAIEPDPEATVSGPMAKPEPDPHAALTGPQFDPDATLNPAAAQAAVDPEATVRIPSPGRRRRNPFAPQASPETLQADLGALGGLNPLVAAANPILGAVPQIRHALKHPDPRRLRDNLRQQIETFKVFAMSADIPGETVDAAEYALCALLDESAASTPWGAGWAENGLLHEQCGEAGGGEGFFARLDRICEDPDGNADLIEFFFICLALGFEGRYRGAENGREELEQLRGKLYAIVARRRPRPRDGLSERWRSTASPGDVKAAVEAVPATTPAQAAAQVPTFRVRLRRSPAVVAAAVLATVVVGFLLSLRLMEDEDQVETTTRPRVQKALKPAPAAPVVAPVAVPSPSSPSLSRDLANEAVVVAEEAGRIAISLRDEHQFGSGNAAIKAELRPLLRSIGQALERAPGAILVAGHSDAVPVRPGRLASNQELSAARAQSVAKLIAAELSDARRVTAAGKGDSDQAAPNDTEANRAKNRRVTIVLRPGP